MLMTSVHYEHRMQHAHVLVFIPVPVLHTTELAKENQKWIPTV